MEFRKGMRVRSTDLARERFIFPREREGIVASDQRYPNVVRVKLDSRKSACSYFVDFWELAPLPCVDVPAMADCVVHWAPGWPKY